MRWTWSWLWGYVGAQLGRRSRVLEAILLALTLLLAGCATTHSTWEGEANTCDVSKYSPGHAACLPQPAIFCEDPPPESSAQSAINKQFLGDLLFPDKHTVGPNVPVCPPNGTRLVQEQDAKDARKGAREIGRMVGFALTTCENYVEFLTKQPDNLLAGWNMIEPEEIEEKLVVCARALDAIPAIPEYEDPWLVMAAADGFARGYGDGVDEVLNRLLIIDLAIAAVEVALTSGVELVDIAVTRGVRMSLAAARRMPIFIPGAIGGGGAFLKNAPRAAVRVVAEGSSRVLGRNLKLAGFFRLPGEFAHHIVAHGDRRAKNALDILKRFGIKVDEAVNGVFLPGYKTSPNPTGKIIHGNLHTDEYYRRVEAALNLANTKGDAVRILRGIAWKLEHGMMP